MNQPTVRHRFTTGRHCWLIIAVSLGVVSAVAIGLVPSSQAAAAKDCRQETLLPADVRLIAPGPDMPEAMARGSVRGST